MIAICENCDNQYKISPSLYNRSKHHFCSRKCSFDFSRDRRIAQIKEIGKSTRFSPGDKKHKNHRVLSGPDHYAWKGENVGYRGLHAWIRRVAGDPGPCVDCGSIVNCQWSNTDGKYRRVASDYVSRCASCHKFHDLNLATIQDAQDSLPQ